MAPVLGQPQTSGEQGQNAQKPSAGNSEAQTPHGNPAPAESGHQPTDRRSKEQEGDKGPFAAVLSWVLEPLARFIEFADANDKAFVALGTLVLAVFTVILSLATVALWLATKRLVRGAEKTAELQLRAYLVVEAAIAGEPSKNKSISAEVIVKNYGQTPARNVVVSRGIDILPTGGISRSSNMKPLTPTNLGPGGRVAAIAVLEDAEEQRERLAAEDISGLGVVVFGEVTYEDIFRIKRTTEYRLVMIPVVGGGVHLAPCAEGNRYT